MNEAGRVTMTEKERAALRDIAEAVPHIPDFRRGYLIGYGDAISDKKEPRKKDQPTFAEEK